jgi:dihydrofolate reductase
LLAARREETTMRKLSVFESITLDGYFSGPNGDIGWAHEGADDPEFHSFVEKNAKGGGPLLFGRKTYELMKSYWPTAEAKKNDPVVAEQMNNLPKFVFSSTLDKADWNNTTVVKGDLASEVRKMKEKSGDDMVIMGSGSIVSQLTEKGLIDEYQVVVIPVVIGQGKTMFDGVKEKVPLDLKKTRSFDNGRVFLLYEPAP